MEKINKKIKKIVLLFTILLVTIAATATADTGCFVYQDSGQYCQELKLVEAEEECSFFDGCQLNHHYYANEPCSSLSVCEQIFCKSSCDYEYLGKCSSGEVPLGEEAKWCSAGCCRFIFHNSFYCNYEPNKWLCEIAAVNKDVASFSYVSWDQTTCESFCYGQDSMGKFLSENVTIETPQSPQQNALSSPPKQQEVLSDLGTLMGGGNQPVLDENEEGATPWFLLGLILIGVGIYWFHKQFGGLNFGKKLKLPSLPEQDEKKRKKKIFLHELRFHPQVQERIKKLKEQHKEHVKEQKKNEFLSVFGGQVIKGNKKEFQKTNKLKNLVREHHKKKFGAITKGIKLKTPSLSRQERKKEKQRKQKEAEQRKQKEVEQKKEKEANFSAVSKLKKIVESKK